MDMHSWTGETTVILPHTNASNSESDCSKLNAVHCAAVNIMATNKYLFGSESIYLNSIICSIVPQKLSNQFKF